VNGIRLVQTIARVTLAMLALGIIVLRTMSDAP
jgi:hypothetical protein